MLFRLMIILLISRWKIIFQILLPGWIWVYWWVLSNVNLLILSIIYVFRTYCIFFELLVILFYYVHNSRSNFWLWFFPILLSCLESRWFWFIFLFRFSFFFIGKIFLLHLVFFICILSFLLVFYIFSY